MKKKRDEKSGLLSEIVEVVFQAKYAFDFVENRLIKE